MTPIGLYVHVPFCAVKCPYCDFYSVKFSMDAARAFTDAVVRNLKALPEGLCADTIYFGGGTPSLLPEDCLRAILTAAGERLCLQDPEITLEVNPLTITPKSLAAWQRLGINRLSIGVQSCVDTELTALGRRHTAKRALDAVRAAHDAGFFNLSCDLMLGVAGQSERSLDASLWALSALPIQHVSVYMLSLEPGTPFDSDDMRRLVPGEDIVADWYLQTVETLRENGFLQYEISNFAKPGFESRHNGKYWKSVDYIGIGPAAHSCFHGKRTAVPRDLDAFVAAPVQPMEVTEPHAGSFAERAMLRLRLTEGLPLCEVPDQEALLKRAQPLAKAGLVTLTPERICLTVQGFLVSNAVIGRLIFAP